MEFKKEYSDNKLEKWAIELYGWISNYGESVGKSVLWIIFAITSLPLVAWACEYFGITIVVLFHLIKDVLLLLVLIFTNVFLIAYGVLAVISLDYHTTLTNLDRIFTQVKSIINYVCSKISLLINSKQFLYGVMFYISIGIYYSVTQKTEMLMDTITAFFQLKIDTNGNYKHIMKYWEPVIRIISLILLGNLYIALRRRLSRK
jgi:hypothetical protein